LEVCEELSAAAGMKSLTAARRAASLIEKETLVLAIIFFKLIMILAISFHKRHEYKADYQTPLTKAIRRTESPG